MKKTLRREIHFCDGCEAESNYLERCLQCGKEYCINCQEDGETYQHAVIFKGHKDGFYCQPCVDGGLKTTDLLTAYLQIKALVKEYKTFYDDWRKRSDAAEKELSSLIACRKDR